MEKKYWELLTFKSTILEYKYRALYGDGEYKERILKQQKKVMYQYIILIIVMLMALGFGFLKGNKGFPQVTTMDGNIVSVERPNEGESPYIMKARIVAEYKNNVISEERQLLIAPVNNKKEESNILRKETKTEVLQRRIGNAVHGINKDTSKKRINLPERMSDGTIFRWRIEKQGTSPIIFPACVVVLFLIRRGRFEKMRKEEQAARESIIHHLPEFLNKLVLLLNGGLVLQVAFHKIMVDHGEMRENKEKYFYNQLYIIHEKIVNTNAQMHIELRSFAKRAGVRELMRIANIIYDNVATGNDLVEKLKRESEIMWFLRKKQAEEKGRLIETKLTLPMVLLLLVLIMVTIAPVLIQVT